MLIKVQDEEGRDTDKFNKRVNFEMLVKRQKNMSKKSSGRSRAEGRDTDKIQR